MNTPKRLLAIALVSVLLAGCAANQPSTGGSPQPSGPIRIAGIYSLTGAQGINGVVFKEGSDAALKFLNKKGGIKGRPVEIEYFDDQSRPERTVALFQQAAADPGFLAVLGPTGATTPAGTTEATKQGIPVIGLGGDENSSIDPGRWAFKQAVTFDHYSLAMMRFIRDEMKLTKIGLIWQPDAYGSSFEKTIKENIAKFPPLQLVAAEGVPQQSPDVTIQIQRVLNAGAQVMILGTSSTNAVPVNNWAALGSPIPIIGGIGLSSPLQIRGAEDAGKKVSAIVAYFTGDDPLPRQKEMVAEFQKTEGKVAQYQNGSGWDGVMMLARVLESGADTREKVRDALETMFTKWEGVAGIYTFSKTSHQGYDPDGLIFVQYLGDGHYKRWSK